MSAELLSPEQTVVSTGVRGEIIAANERRTNVAVTPLDMLNKAVASGANIDVLTKLMDLHERWEAGQARKDFDAAVAEAKCEITPVIRNKSGHNSKRYADFAAIASSVDPIISRFGLSYRFRTTQTDRISVTCVLSHKSGHCEETTLSGPPDTSGNKNAIQAIGSTLTYLQRYSLVQALGLAAADDDDGRAAGKPDADGGVISDEQAEKLRDTLTRSGGDIDRFVTHFKIECVPDLPAARFDEAMRMLDVKIAKQGGAK